MRDSGNLRHLVSQRLASIRRAALASGGQLNTTQIEELEQLACAMEVAEHAEHKQPPRRWPLAAALLMTLLIVGVLVFSRVWTTQIELDVMVNEVRFDLSRHQQITGEIAVSSLSATGLTALRMPRATSADGQLVPGGEKDWSRVQLSLPREGEKGNRLTLAAVAP